MSEYINAALLVIGTLWLIYSAAFIGRLEAEHAALLAEHEAWDMWCDAERAASKIPSDEEWRELRRLEEAHQVAYDNAERVLRGE